MSLVPSFFVLPVHEPLLLRPLLPEGLVVVFLVLESGFMVLPWGLLLGDTPW